MQTVSPLFSNFLCYNTFIHVVLYKFCREGFINLHIFYFIFVSNHEHFSYKLYTIRTCWRLEGSSSTYFQQSFYLTNHWKKIMPRWHVRYHFCLSCFQDRVWLTNVAIAGYTLSSEYVFHLKGIVGKMLAIFTNLQISLSNILIFQNMVFI